jgi:hypothetical protein
MAIQLATGAVENIYERQQQKERIDPDLPTFLVLARNVEKIPRADTKLQEASAMNVQKMLLAIAAAAAMLTGPMAANAVPIVYDYTYNGTSLTTNQSAAGTQLLTGDVVDLTVRSFGSDFWSWSGGSLWAPIHVSEGATRVGSLSWSLLLNGATVASGSYVSQPHDFVHISNSFLVGAVSFDELHWQYTSVSSTSPTNTLGGLIVGSPFLSGRPVYNVGSIDVPEPGTIALFGLGFAGLGFIRRRRRV